MAKEGTHPVGSKIRIKNPGKRPDGWNTDMMPLIGETASIKRVNGKGRNTYRYRLTRWDWAWRHCDLELLEAGKLNPNVEFRNKKYANR